MKEIIYAMLKTNTGKALCDSGDAYGRHHERNATKSMADFENEPEVCFEEGYYLISLWHYLNKNLNTDNICDDFNEKFKTMTDWDGEAYGISEEAGDWLTKYEFGFGESFNSYNWCSALSQTIQGTWLKQPDKDENRKYLLLQIHQGCDVRGGYTDAKMFVVDNLLDGAMSESVYGVVIDKEGEVLGITNEYNGQSLTYCDNDEEYVYSEGDEVELSLNY